MSRPRPLLPSLIACLVVSSWCASPAVGALLRVDVPVASFCIDGAFPVAVTAGGTVLNGTLTMVAGDAAAVTGELAIGAESFALTGKQKARKGVLGVTLKGMSAAGVKVTLKGTAAGTHLVGTISGKLGGVKLPSKSPFDADLTGAPPFVVRTTINVTIDPTTGAVAGAGNAAVCGATVGVTVTGSTNLPKAVARGKAATGKLTIVGATFTFSGKGPLIQLEDDSLGFVVAWKGKGRGVAASGKNLRVAPVIDGPSSGEIALHESFATRFHPLVLRDVVLTVSGATPSTNPIDYAFTLDGVPLAPGVTVDAQQGTVTLGELPLVDGRNDLTVVGRDTDGLVLSAVVTLWAGVNELVVAVRDEADQAVAGAGVTLRLGDDQRVVSSGTSNATGEARFANIPNRTLLAHATGAAGATGDVSATGIAGTVDVVLRGFDAPSPIDNNDFATGDAAGWNIGPTATIVPHEEEVGPQAPLVARAPVDPDVDLALATGGEGQQQLSRTFTTDPETVAVTLRYRFVTSEFPGGFFGTKYNDAFAVSIRSQNGGGEVSESNTMNGLGFAAFDASGATAWREVTLPLAAGGDVVQVDAAVANVADEFFGSVVLVDKVAEVSLSLAVANASRILLETNRFEIIENPPGSASNFRVEIRRANGPTPWIMLAPGKVVDNFKHRTAGTFKVRGVATVGGKVQITKDQDLVVQFPAFADIVADAAVVGFTDAAFASTKSATTATSRREEGFNVLLDTNPGAEKYLKTTTTVGPAVGPTEGGSVDFDPPPDNPPSPSPVEAAVYTVASFHTHTPNAFRPFARAAGPTPTDRQSDTTDKLTGIVYDYVGVNGLVPANHPLNSPAQRYQSGPSRRPTPP